MLPVCTELLLKVSSKVRIFNDGCLSSGHCTLNKVVVTFLSWMGPASKRVWETQYSTIIGLCNCCVCPVGYTAGCWRPILWTRISVLTAVINGSTVPRGRCLWFILHVRVFCRNKYAKRILRPSASVWNLTPCCIEEAPQLTFSTTPPPPGKKITPTPRLLT
jgi:hypothetical protein